MRYLVVKMEKTKSLKINIKTFTAFERKLHPKRDS